MASDAIHATEIVVEFDMGEVRSGQLGTRLGYLDMAKSQPTRVSGATVERSLWAAQRDAATLVRVREAYSKQAIAGARGLAAAGEFSDAQDLITLARAENMDVAQAMRKSRDLAAVQAELSRVRGELEPPAKRTRRPAPRRKIDIMRMDRL